MTARFGTIEYAAGRIVAELGDAAADLEARARAIRAFADLVGKDDPAELADPRTSFGSNLVSVIDAGRRATRYDQSAATALNQLHALYAAGVTA